MHIRTCLLALFALLSTMPVPADELADLRAENARLRAQLEAVQKSDGQIAAPAANPAAVPRPSASDPVNSATPGTAPSPPLAEAPNPAPAATAASAATPTSTEPVAPSGYKLVRVAPLPPSQRYMDTGCSRGLFQGPPPAAWINASAWESLQRDMQPAQVEALLGIEHHDVEDRGKLQWQYGRCGDSVAGWVLFEGGRVRSWSAPDQ